MNLEFLKNLGVSAIIPVSKVIFILLGLWAIYRWLKKYFARPTALGLSNSAYRSLALQSAQLILFILGAMILLDTAGISITPLIASLGIGSIAIAFALQDTLSNFISGIFLLIDQPIRPGDNVRAPEGAEGVVKNIGWRSTRIENSSGHTVMIPNSKLSSAIITNFDIPTREINLPITFVVDALTDPDLLENVVRKTLKTTIENRSECVKSVEPAFLISNLNELGKDCEDGRSFGRCTCR